MLLQAFGKVEKSMPIRMPKVIVDEERNRRTREKLANQRPWFEGGANSKTVKRVPTTTPNGMNK